MSGIEVLASAFPTFCPSSYRSWHMRPDDALQFPLARPEGQNDLPKISSPPVRSFLLSVYASDGTESYKEILSRGIAPIKIERIYRLDCFSDATPMRPTSTHARTNACSRLASNGIIAPRSPTCERIANYISTVVNKND